MKRLLLLVFLMFSFKMSAQSDALAKQYFNDGNFEKAVVLYKKLYGNNPNNLNYFQSLISCYQQLESYEEAEKLILTKTAKENYAPAYLVELGYNYLLKGDTLQGHENYGKAISRIGENPAYAYSVGAELKKKSALEFAIKAYKKGMEINPDLNFNYDLAFIYGELGDIENMYNTYLDLIAFRDSFKGNVQRNIGRFISEESSADNNQLLKKVLLKRTQTDPNIIWNELLSWLFIQQKQFNSAFVQEKAIFKRAEEPSMERIINLGLIALQEKDNEAAKEIFNYLTENFNAPAMRLLAGLHVVQIEVDEATVKEYDKIESKFVKLLNEFGYTSETIKLQIAYANFLAFKKNDPGAAEKLLRVTLGSALTKFDEATVKMALADILVYDEKFNQALIFYSQVQKMVKNDVLAQTARFKVAQTSFYKGDFEWAESQLKVLKSSTSQLIANDALQLKLLISDNSIQDSTQTALRLYAKADLMAFQNKDTEAIALLDTILMNHKGERIEDEALLKQAKLFEKQKGYEKAKLNYMKIIEFYPQDILADDAIYALAELYNNYLNEPEKAKELYERIIFNHADSVFLVEARKKYRRLRGDAIN